MDSAELLPLIEKEMGKTFNLKRLDKSFKKKWTSEEQQKITKQKVNLVNFYERLINKYIWKGMFDSGDADKLLQWQFNLDEERKQAKSAIGTDKFIQQGISYLWVLNYDSENNDTEKPKVECLKLLNWFFEGDQVDSYRNEKLIQNEDFIKSFTRIFSDEMCWETIDKFLEFCNCTPEKLKEIKRQIFLNLNDWIKYFTLNCCSVPMADSLIKWICPDERKKRKVIKKFLRSDHAPYIIAMVVNNLDGDTYNKNITVLFNSWIRGNIKIEKVRKDLQDCDYNMLKGKYVALLDAFLDILEKGKEIKSRDINVCVNEYIMKENYGYQHKCKDAPGVMENEVSDSEESDYNDEEFFDSN